MTPYALTYIQILHLIVGQQHRIECRTLFKVHLYDRFLWQAALEHMIQNPLYDLLETCGKIIISVRGTDPFQKSNE